MLMGSGVYVTASLSVWHQRELQILYSLAACFCDMKDFRLAMDIYREILVRDPDNVHYTYSTLGRICMQVSCSHPRLEVSPRYFHIIILPSCSLQPYCVVLIHISYA